MERIDRIAPDGVLDAQNFFKDLQSVLDGLEMGHDTNRAIHERAAHDHVSTFLASPTFQEIRSGTNTRSEFPIQTLLSSGDVLYGIIDRLFQDKNGTWTILDYKTEARTNAKNIARYEFQLQFYAYLVHRMNIGIEHIRGILFFTATGETREFQFSSSDFVQFEKECASLIEQIRTQENIPDLRLLRRNTDHCPECGFFEQTDNECVVLTSHFQNPTATPAM